MPGSLVTGPRTCVQLPPSIASRREGALGVAQLIEVAQLLAERVLEGIEPSPKAEPHY